MNEDIKERWVERLRSGLPQSASLLKRVDENNEAIGYCCLGVLCDLAVEDGIVIEAEYDNDNRETTYISVSNPDDRSYEFLPMAVQNWAGLDAENPIVKITPELIKKVYPFANEEYYNTVNKMLLSTINDNGESFETIADLIEESL